MTGCLWRKSKIVLFRNNNKNCPQMHRFGEVRLWHQMSWKQQAQFCFLCFQWSYFWTFHSYCSTSFVCTSLIFSGYIKCFSLLIGWLGFISLSGVSLNRFWKWFLQMSAFWISHYCGFMELKLFYIFQNWVCFKAPCVLSLFSYSTFLCL